MPRVRYGQPIRFSTAPAGGWTTYVVKRAGETVVTLMASGLQVPQTASFTTLTIHCLGGTDSLKVDLHGRKTTFHRAVSP